MTDKIKKIGIVMPISPAQIEGYPDCQWDDVLAIIKQSFQEGYFSDWECEGVWEGTGGHLITNTIFQEIYEDDIVICDLSTSNPNVLYEAGLRMILRKPIFFIMDDKSNYLFDIKDVHYIKYPQSLRLIEMEKWKIRLVEGVKSLWEKYEEDKDDFSQIPNIKQTGKAPKAILKEENMRDVMMQALKRVMHDTEITTNKEIEQLKSRLFQIKDDLSFIEDTISNKLFEDNSDTILTRVINQLDSIKQLENNGK
ncbi:hypothetical protein I6N96_05100 [Enterococcus sp. BWM-S5]|uniref:Uncharacterized protein n=1 Tax=Enterococcus larvae TaxID=2794352 RepID=A0ABS4CG94_9ENTE|nr:hypothetical protein [Enterococcus larvae]MBP1045646.1 hypothetical protein [Enterococcus larvae]